MRPPRTIYDPTPAPLQHLLLRSLRQELGAHLLPRFGPGPASTGIRSIYEARTVAVVHWESLGDAILLSPVLRECRRALPDASIVLVHGEEHSSYFECCPHIDRRYGLPFSGHPLPGEAHGAASSTRARALLAARTLRTDANTHGPIDLVIGPEWLDPVFEGTFFDSALFRRGGGRRLIRRLHSGNIPDIDLRQHHVLRNLAILAAFGIIQESDALEAWMTPEDRQAAVAALPEIDAGPTVAIAIGAGVKRRRWPVDRLMTVAVGLRDSVNARIVIIGGPTERSLLTDGRLADLPYVVDLVGRTSVRETAAVLERCDLLIGNDSGPVHLAAAVDTPTVVISQHATDGEEWAMSSPFRYRPWGNRSIVLQPRSVLTPCRGTCIAEEPHCILEITPNEVLEASRRLLSVGGS